MTNKLIFGKSWDEISSMQQKTHKSNRISGAIVKPIATDKDKALLTDKGIDWLTNEQFFGVIDRLRNSNLIK